MYSLTALHCTALHGFCCRALLFGIMHCEKNCCVAIFACVIMALWQLASVLDCDMMCITQIDAQMSTHAPASLLTDIDSSRQSLRLAWSQWCSGSRTHKWKSASTSPFLLTHTCQDITNIAACRTTPPQCSNSVTLSDLWQCRA